MSSRKRFQAYASCIVACEECIKICIENGYTRCMELCRECSELCTLGMRLELQDAESVLDFYNVCKKLCVLCAEECLQHKNKSCINCFQACKMLMNPEIYF